jgi:midasin (ATPase involved in ribosome maturation)
VFKDGLVGTPSLLKIADEAITEMQSHTFRHFAVIGEEGCGKMSLVKIMKERADGDCSKFIVVTLEETFDSKNLVGTYVCNETGEFVFKKGPLTVAAEQGLWLILRNIEQAPADLLSFLLPLVQEDKLKVTSAFTITPKLGFRIVALCQRGSS